MSDEHDVKLKSREPMHNPPPILPLLLPVVSSRTYFPLLLLTSPLIDPPAPVVGSRAYLFHTHHDMTAEVTMMDPRANG